MIAPAKSYNSARVRNLGVVSVGPDSDPSSERNAVDTSLQVTRRWVNQHPTAALVTSVALGLLLGYVFKRRNS